MHLFLSPVKKLRCLHGRKFTCWNPEVINSIDWSGLHCNVLGRGPTACAWSCQRHRKQPRAAGPESRKRALSPYLTNKQKEIFYLLHGRSRLAVFINLISVQRSNLAAASAATGRRCPALLCLLAAVPSKDTAIHAHKWPILNHGIWGIWNVWNL